MTLPDVNVLIHAFRADSPRHDVAKPWFDGVIAGNARFAISRLALSAVVRITSGTPAFRQPSPLHEVFAFCSDVMGQPHCTVVEPGERHWAIFEQLCTGTNTRGPKVTDAWFAALAIEHGCTWITFDRDFARFPGLDWREPA
jgi:toxin-antitoxin system PIN domain toxin